MASRNRPWSRRSDLFEDFFCASRKESVISMSSSRVSDRWRGPPWEKTCDLYAARPFDMNILCWYHAFTLLFSFGFFLCFSPLIVVIYTSNDVKRVMKERPCPFSWEIDCGKSCWPIPSPIRKNHITWGSFQSLSMKIQETCPAGWIGQDMRRRMGH